MSLLMDALKRAEKARQAEAGKPAAGQDTSGSQKLSLEQRDDWPRADGSSAPGSQSPSQPSPGTPDARPLSLESDGAGVPPPAPSGSKTTGYLRPFSLLDDDSMSPADSGEMPPIAREAEEAVKKYFDDTGPMTANSDEEPHRGADAAAGAQASTRDESGHRNAASTVFEAKTGTRRRGYAAVIVVPVFLMVFLGVSGFFLWDELVRVFVGGPPSLIVRRPPPVDITTPVTREAAPAETNSAAAEPLSTDMAAGSISESRTEPTSSARDSTDQSAEIEKIVAAAEAAAAERGAMVQKSMEKRASEKPAAVVPEVTTTESVSAAPNNAADEKIAELTDRALSNLASAGHLSAVPSLKISKKPIADRTHEALRSAYDAFRQGDNARARNLYERVLSQDSRNRNALLGLGAIDTRTGNIGAARRTYARLLTLNPRDPVARAALIDSHRDVSPIEGEGHIKELLARNASQPFLYVTLGNLYARQQRWPEAQQAYFDAYRLDQNNADYAFNLAVSLDRLGQQTTALSFYRRALDLAERGQASFEPQTVLKRISSLGTAETR